MLENNFEIDIIETINPLEQGLKRYCLYDKLRVRD